MFTKKNLNVTEISNQISLMFDVNSTDLDMEITKLQNDMYLKTQTFIWKYTKDKYPIVTNIALKMMAYFGSTYLAESAFSDMNIIKSENRNSLTDDQCLRLFNYI